jgi:hypothetical protein
MTDAAAVKAFISKWEQNTQKESAAAKEHFAELCRLIGVPTPNDPGSGPATYCFEKSLTKTGGKAGFADVWKKDRFAWEYKGKQKSATLDAAYAQLLLYKEDLGNPPILVVCDIASYEVHVAFTGYQTRVFTFTNAELENASNRELLRLVFTDPEQLRPVERQETITKQAAERFAQVAGFLEKRGFAPSQIAPFFMKVLFALFAEDIRILPGELMTEGIKQAIFKPSEFVPRTQALFRTMHTGGYFGQGDRVPQFNGWLFKDDQVLLLNANELTYLAEAAKLDWSQVEPAIFGTLFERSLDPSKRAQLGLHYTSRDDILLIVEPVLMQPLRREWAEAQVGVEALRVQWEGEGISPNRQRQLKGVAEGLLLELMERLAKVRVLDPACGSGNFLYVALNELKNLEKEVWMYAGGVGLQQPDLAVSPAQLHGIEKNQFAAELAQVVVWIGYLQWQRTNGFFDVQEPILQTLHNIECRDAVLTVDLHGQPAEPVWPEADVIVGNPPFLGGSKLRRELGDTYTETLWKLYESRVPGFADLVCYWFERTRALIADSKVQRAGLLATQGIRGGANRKVLERIKQSGDIFFAWSDRDWVLDGAAVHVSMVGFDGGIERLHILDGQAVGSINPDLTGTSNLTEAIVLRENAGIAFKGPSPGGSFDIPDTLAQVMLSANNASDRANSDVIVPVLNAADIMRGRRNCWTIDFRQMSLEEASLYERPFEYVRQTVYPERVNNKIKAKKWWLYERPRVDLREALKSLSRYIVTPRVSKHRVFVWISTKVLANDANVAITRDDDYMLGLLQSKSHELWARRLGTQLREAESGSRYTSTTTFETFPFPWPPGKEDQADPRVEAIAEAARELVRLRDEWLNPADAGPLSGVNLKDRTLTNLYNRRPDWLDLAHRRLDAAVFDAYGWPHDLSDDEILARLLALNLERAAGQGEVPGGVENQEADNSGGDE